MVHLTYPMQSYSSLPKANRVKTMPVLDSQMLLQPGVMFDQNSSRINGFVRIMGTLGARRSLRLGPPQIKTSARTTCIKLFGTKNVANLSCHRTSPLAPFTVRPSWKSNLSRRSSTHHRPASIKQ